MSDKSNLWPAEWSPHSGCIILYPHNARTFSLARAQVQFEAVIRAIATDGHETVHVFCVNEGEALRVSQLFTMDGAIEDPRIHVHVCASNDTWARDTAPTFVVQRKTNKLIGIDWDFNAYGGPDEGCYWPCDLDQRAAEVMCHTLAVRTQKIDLILEGGSIHTDGEGTLLTTEECLLNKNRNVSKSKQEIEDAILEATGCEKVIWLKRGLAHDDDTNGHVDNFACFVDPAHIVLAWTDNQRDDKENYERCREALHQIRQSTDARGRSIRVTKLLLPMPISYTQQQVDALERLPTGETLRTVGERMAASYVNFYIANRAIIVPQFGDRVHDSKAIKTLRQIFPDRKAVAIPSQDILCGGGNIHCITQQIPE